MAKGNFTASVAGDALALMMIRLTLGTIFIAHGSQKLLGLFGGSGLTATFRAFEEKMGIPPVFTFLAIIAEFGGGIGVLLGLLTRFSAAGIAATMAVAIYKVTLVNGFFLNVNCIPGRGSGIEYNLALIAMALALVLKGGGPWSVDRFLWKR
jgi:putative oxidoreductase